MRACEPAWGHTVILEGLKHCKKIAGQPSQIGKDLLGTIDAV